MADLPLHRLPDPELEVVLRQLAGEIAWPAARPEAAGPDLAATVRARIDAAPRRPAAPEPTVAPGPTVAPEPTVGRSWIPRWTWRPARRALLIAIIIVLALAALAGAAALGLPGLRLILGDAPVSPPPSLEPHRSPTPGVPGAGLGLGRAVDLADLDAGAAFAVGRPSDPEIGPPDAAFIDPAKGGQVTLVWASRPGLPDTLEPGVGLLLSAFQGAVDEGYYSKALSADTSVEIVVVDGKRAYWLSGDPHFFFYEGPNGTVDDSRRWVGDALLWANGPITYRLETSLGRERAIAIAESMR